MTRDTRTLASKHFPIEARLVRTLLNAEAADLLPAFTLTQQSPRHKLTVTGPAWAFSYLAARLRGLAACAKGEWNGAAKCYEKLADTFTAAPAAPAPEEPVTEEPVTEEHGTEEPALLATVELGESPVGVVWNVYPLPHETRHAFEARVQVARERLAALHAKHAPVAQEPAPAAPVTEEPVTEEPVYYSCTSDLRPALKRLGYEQAGGGVFVPKRKQEELVAALRDAARAHKAYTEPAPAAHVLSARAQGVRNHEAALASHEIAAQAHKVVARLLILAQRITEHVYRAAITERLHRPAPVEPVTEEPVTEEPAPVAQEPARPRPARHRNALAHLAGLNDVVRDFLVDTYATETGMRWHERDPHTWTERDARACLATQYLEELGYMPPRTCDTWEDVRELVREAYRLEALYA